MAPDSGVTRELTTVEYGQVKSGLLKLGDRLADGNVVVSGDVAHALEVGRRELNRRQRRRQARGRDPWG